ncbi:ATP-dependent zinc metalloprotease FTSH 12, chloroplastic [Amborella trichopoda]|uniref:ATP-dependent zinc metalloprotease FTSH 12, chloroplastic n=1 Tax=Amborella trichopoda TaxID=13333 RepID=UPI0005D454F6|nr:ATP-dependent zinc metalloprotease FTSH 12, chloroplastic [Amborella trichopoda]|eukprot:XP_011628477.1 ATP-dependent zinc metalloprotease FTSH 12, chloroplastic [Amborella trichopoda]
MSSQPFKPLPLSSILTQNLTHPLLLNLSPSLNQLNFFTSQRRLSHRRIHLRASASNENGKNDNPLRNFSWEKISQGVSRGSKRLFSNFGKQLKEETGFDVEAANSRVNGFMERFSKAKERGNVVLERLRVEWFPQFIEWNKWDNWKDLKNWEPARIGALLLYTFLLAVTSHGIFMAVTVPRLDRGAKQKLTDAYMEALIPEPSPINVRKFKKGMWRKTMPKGLRMKKFIEGPDGILIHDNSYVGEDAWEEDPAPSQEDVAKMIDQETSLDPEQRKELKEELGIRGTEQENSGTWQERLHKWKEILKADELVEELDSSNARYVVDFDMQEVRKSLQQEVANRVSDTAGTRGLWISKRWWRYRPKFPYMYFLQKLDSSEVAAVVFSEDLKKIYVTMKEGFPLEYVVDIPLDPYLFEFIISSGAEVDMVQRTQLHYLLRVVIALAPGLLLLWLIRESMMLLHITSQRFLHKKYLQLFDMAYAENFIMPVNSTTETRSMYKEVILGGDVWDLLDELMIYMGNPMPYFDKEVKFVRGVLLSGPPGTGKTLFARTLAKESGLPFVFASGAEFTDSEKSGAARINEIFSIARRNAPCFVFIDEIDAIAGRHARKDPRRGATFEALMSQLDGEKEKTGVDRFSLRQAVIFICATNRPDELDLDFVRPGRIDRRLHIGLPDANQRVQIFGVHSAGKELADDVDFKKLVFRTVGYSGADIRNLVNEAGIMSVRKGHSQIYQQDIIDVLDKQLLEGMGVLLTEEEQQKSEASVSVEKKRLLAVHEAGHILLAHLFPRYDWHAFSQLLPGGKETALSVFYPREDMIDQGYTTFGYMKMQMVVAHGGRCAELVVFGDGVTDGGRDDLEKISKIGREMVISPRNARLGLTALIKRYGVTESPDSPDGELIKYKWEDPHVIPVDMTPELSELFTRELTRYIEETEEYAMDGLMRNRHILDRIVDVLLERSRLTGLEVQEIVRQMNPSMFDDFVEPFQINLDEEGPMPVNNKLRYRPLDVYPAPLHRC